ncbi:MAG: hypothetical protein ACXAE3_09665 [Candidatus Kariarchaeaceae archaeon]|jgi:tellurite resistance protein
MVDQKKFKYETSLKALLLSVVKQAQADGIITADEGELINSIQIDAREFEEEIAKAIKAGKTTMKEIFVASKDKMIQNATDTARKDGKITEEEEAIINKLVRELENIDIE